MLFEMYNEPNPEQPSVPEWYWQLTKICGNIVIAKSAVSFKTKEECEANILLVTLTDHTTPIVQCHAKPDGLLKHMKFV